MRRSKSGAGLVVVGLAIAAAAGCASETTTTTTKKAGSGDVVADRQRLMKLNGGAWTEVQAKAKAGNMEGVAVSAETLALNAQQIPAMFPAGSMTDKSKAKPEVWQKLPEFEAAAKKMEAGVGEAPRRRPREERTTRPGHRQGLRSGRLRHLPHAVPGSAAAFVVVRAALRRGRSTPLPDPPHRAAGFCRGDAGQRPITVGWSHPNVDFCVTSRLARMLLRPCLPWKIHSSADIIRYKPGDVARAPPPQAHVRGRLLGVIAVTSFVLLTILAAMFSSCFAVRPGLLCPAACSRVARSRS